MAKIVFIICFLLFGVVPAFGEPSFNNWSWPHALDKINTLSESIGSNCRLWVEAYGSSSYRVWKRCGVNATASSAYVKDYSFIWSGSLNVTNGSACNSSGAQRLIQNGDGTLQFNTACPNGSLSWSAGSVAKADGGILTWVQPDSTRFNDYGLTCVGSSTGGTVDGVLGGNALRWSTVGAYVRDTSAAGNTVSSTCLNADSLLIDFGAVASSCDSTQSITAVVRGHEASVGSCGCIPLGFGITSYTAPNTCSVARITGDPAKVGDSSPPVGSSVSVPGDTFTNEDLASLPSGSGQIPIAGSDANGGIADGYGIDGPQGGATPTAGSGGSGPGLGGTGGTDGGTGGGGTGGGGTCEFENCNDDGTEDIGTIPNVPEYDPGLDTLVEDDWVTAAQNFLSSSPLIAALQGSTVSASGSECSFAGSAFGESFTFNFCSYGSALAALGTLLVVISHLAAFFIVWRN